MIRGWRFTDLEFVVLWEELREHRLPAPFIYTSRTEYLHEAERAKREAREGLRERGDSSFDGVLAAVARPDLRITVSGCAAADPEDPRGRIRVHAARSGPRCFVLTQLPGETIWHSGGFTVAEYNALEMADAVVARMPAYPGGHRQHLTFPATLENSDCEYGQSWVRETDDSPRTDPVGEFWSAPVLRFGIIQIEQGSSRFGPRGVARRALAWRDVAEDGRYVLAGDPAAAMGVDARHLIARINSEIAWIVRAIKDERAGQPHRA
ncbi:ESX secretion-associated protein EspG [Nocardia sp. NPDC051832]|uniref:ESX secretion-associated protein EspG n=1 Tax=Nocardia sp. NPDC051832 TaxID=3155673 RepID=UPI0034275CA1